MPYIALALLNRELGLFLDCVSVYLFKMLVPAHLDLSLSELEKAEAQQGPEGCRAPPWNRGKTSPYTSRHIPAFLNNTASS